MNLAPLKFVLVGDHPMGNQFKHLQSTQQWLFYVIFHG